MIDVGSLSLLRGSPVELKNVGYVHPFVVGDIERLTEKVYEKYLQFLTINEDDLRNILKLKDKSFSTYDFIVANCRYDPNINRVLIVSGLSYIFREPVFYSEAGYFYIGDQDEKRILSDENYDDFKKIVRLQNCLDKKEKDVQINENPADAKAAEILEKRREARKKLTKSSNKDGDILSWEDLISILCANGNGITMSNVWSLPVYAFNNQFTRMKMIEEFDIGIRSLLAGAEQENIEIVHWMSKL